MKIYVLKDEFGNSNNLIEVDISDEDIIKLGDRYFELKAKEAKARETHGNIGQIDGTSIVPC